MSEISRLREQLELRTAELRACEERFRNIIFRSADGILLVSRAGIILFVNPAAERIFGRSAGELEGEPFGFSLSGERTEISIAGAGDETLTMEMRLVETEWEGEKVCLATLRDITGRLRMEERLRKKKERLEELNRTLEEKIRDEVAKNREKDHLLILQSRQAAMGEMIAGIAHQWRQPLTSISLLIQDLGETYVFGGFDKEYLDDTISKTLNIIQHMSRTIDDFRGFFKRDKEKRRSTCDRMWIAPFPSLRPAFAITMSP